MTDFFTLKISVCLGVNSEIVRIVYSSSLWVPRVGGRVMKIQWFMSVEGGARYGSREDDIEYFFPLECSYFSTCPVITG